MNSLFLILAQDAPAAPKAPGIEQFLPFVLIFVIFYFVLIRPQRQKQKKLQMQVDAMKTGDKVITAGGIHGLITNVKERSAIVKVADNVKLEFEKSSISTVLKKDTERSTDSPAEESKS